jgi:aspartate aminotransferase-like enzyme
MACFNNKVLQTKENAAELAYHDAKVYKAAAELARSTEAELRRLGVPFFAIDESLVLNTTTTTATEAEKGEGKISKEELAVLKRRMLELLQDLCRD